MQLQQLYFNFLLIRHITQLIKELFKIVKSRLFIAIHARSKYDLNLNTRR